MRALILTLLFLLSLPAAYAQEFNAGIVQGLWYAHENVFAETPTRIYVAIRNNTGSDLSGTVEFFDGDRKIGRKNVEALDGRIIESWTDWTPAYGTHTLKATLTRIELNVVGAEPGEVEVVSALAEDTLFVDHDTDKDGVGNEGDTDDDADGISDTQEKANGTDPLKKDKTIDADEDDTEDSQEEETEDDIEPTPESRQSSNLPAGLERYLTNSPAEDVLSSVTSFINESKRDLDTYREKRSEGKKAEETQSTPVNEDGFGTIERAQTQQHSSPLKELSLKDFYDSAWNLFLTLFHTIFSFVLMMLSWILGHPTLVQLCALLLILFLIMKFASRFGRRPKLKKNK